MAFKDFFKSKEAQSQISTISLDKTIQKISLKKGIDLSQIKARVGLALDYSGSMRLLYKSGKVQNMLARLFPIALKFDDNQELDLSIFSNGYNELKPVTTSNYSTYVEKNIINKYSMGGTEYYPVLNNMINNYIVESPSSDPSLIIFITDGDNGSSDKSRTEKLIMEISDKNVFIQFVGIGSDSFNFLEKLDDLPNRNIDNTGFVKASDLLALSDEELYIKILEQYAEWLKIKN